MFNIYTQKIQYLCPIPPHSRPDKNQREYLLSVKTLRSNILIPFQKMERKTDLNKRP